MFSLLVSWAPFIATVAERERTAPNPLVSLFPLILIFVIMYMMLIRPQQKRNKEHQEMVKRLKTGDEVVTAGGIHGTIKGVKENTLNVKISDNVEIEISRGSIASVKNAGGSGGQEQK